MHFFSVEPGAQHVREFIDLLWQVRVLFDFHVIKWVDRGDEDIHLIGSVATSTSVTENARWSPVGHSIGFGNDDKRLAAVVPGAETLPLESADQ